MTLSFSLFSVLCSLFSSFVLFSFILCDDIILILSLFLLYDVLSSFIFVLSSQKKKMSSYTDDQKQEMKKAACAGDWAALEALVKQYGVDIAAADLDGYGRTALHYITECADDAAASGEAIAQLIAAAGAAIDIDARTTNGGWTPIHYASMNGKLHHVRALLRCGASVDVKRDDGGTPTSLCCTFGVANEANKAAILALLSDPASASASSSDTAQANQVQHSAVRVRVRVRVHSPYCQHSLSYSRAC